MEIIEDFITNEEENELIKFINPIIYKTTNAFYKNKETIYNNNFPPILEVLLDKLYNKFNIHFNSIQINEYLQGQGIKDHIDDLSFDNNIIILNLLSNVTFIFKEYDIIDLDGMLIRSHKYKYIEKINLNERSILKISDDYRYKYTHGIEHINKQRISIIFRINKLRN